MRKLNMRRMTYAGLLAAMVAVLTAYVKVPLPAGYAHAGDAAVVLCGLALGPYGAFPAALGSALGDIFSGYTQYALISALVKGVMAFVIGKFADADARVTPRNVLVLALAFVWMPLAYLPADCLLYSPDAAIAAVLGNLSQAAAGMALGIALLAAGKRLPRCR